LLAKIPLSVMDKESNAAVNSYLEEIDKRLGLKKDDIPKVERMFAGF
jgi:tetrahydromethanopterin S-methyltransferase subunit G